MHTVTIEIRAYQDTAGCKPYADWLDSLTDNKTKARIVARVSRMAAGNFGDCKPLRDGVQELKIDFGPGYRVPEQARPGIGTAAMRWRQERPEPRHRACYCVFKRLETKG